MSLTGSLLDGNSGTSYKGAWDASTNTPNIADGSGVNGDYYLVSIAGTQDLGSGSIDFTSGDDVRYNGTIWQKIEGGVNYVPEDVANKATTFSTENNTLYPSVKAVKDQLNLKIDKNTAITGETKTKITYDADGLVVSGVDATTADIADSLNKRYVNDAELAVLGDTSNTNTGDQDLSGLVSKVVMTDNALVRADGVSGNIKNSSIIIDDSGNISGVNQLIASDLKAVFLQIQQGSSSTVIGGGNIFTSDNTLGELRINLTNTSNTSNANAYQEIVAGGSNGGSAFTRYALLGAGNAAVAMGIHTSDSQSFKCSVGSFNGTNVYKVNTTSGDIEFPTNINLSSLTSLTNLGLDAQKNIVSIDAAYGHVTGITTQSIPNATGVNLTTYWNGTPTLSGGVSFASGVFTVSTAGFYQITGSFSFTTNGAGARSANIRVNNSALVGYQNIAPVSNDRAGMNASAGIYLNAGDNVRILAYQGSGITLFTDLAIGGNFSITKTGN
ncbi:MAG: hypothetical protein ACJAY9_000769 [Flavobacteriales bacterium]|jgi:hypothetical protein